MIKLIYTKTYYNIDGIKCVVQEESYVNPRYVMTIEDAPDGKTKITLKDGSVFRDDRDASIISDLVTKWLI